MNGEKDSFKQAHGEKWKNRNIVNIKTFKKYYARFLRYYKIYYHCRHYAIIHNYFAKFIKFIRLKHTTKTNKLIVLRC